MGQRQDEHEGRPSAGHEDDAPSVEPAAAPRRQEGPPEDAPAPVRIAGGVMPGSRGSRGLARRS
jgi:hypothetical protein